MDNKFPKGNDGSHSLVVSFYDIVNPTKIFFECWLHYVTLLKLNCDKKLNRQFKNIHQTVLIAQINIANQVSSYRLICYLMEF